MNVAKWFDPDEELQKLRSASPKPPKVAKVEREEGETLGGLATLGREDPPNCKNAGTWLCPNCLREVCLDPPDPTIFPTRLWSCTKCTTHGTTRAGAPYPVVWIVTRTFQ
jgi:hypothetical protein